MGLFEEQIAGIDKEGRFALLGGNARNLKCFFRQPAQLTGVSPTGLSLSQDIVGVEE